MNNDLATIDARAARLRSTPATHAINNDGGTLEATNGGTLEIVSDISGSGQLKIGDLSTLQLDGSDNGEAITFLGNTSETLTLNDQTVSGAADTINVTSSTKGSFTINGSGKVTTSTGDAIDYTASGGTAVTGTLRTFWSNPAAISRVKPKVSLSPNRAWAMLRFRPWAAWLGRPETASTRSSRPPNGGGSIAVSTGDVTGTGTGSIGINAEIQNASGGTVTISQTGNVSGGQDGILAFAKGSGDVSVTTGGDVTVTTGGNTAGIDYPESLLVHSGLEA